MKLESVDITAESEPYKEPELQTTDIGTIGSEIEELMEELGNNGQTLETVP